ncbi:MAG: VanZ family protein [Chitinophagaceae bacterium]|nr:VanZ family protein [Chitinophagaceae bacterium]
MLFYVVTLHFSHYHCKKKLRKFLYLAATISWLIISIILLTLPSDDFPQENWFDKIWLDKWVHIGMFAVLVLLGCLTWRAFQPGLDAKGLKRAFIITGIIGLVYGIIMEFVQMKFTNHRSFEIADIITDAVGCALGVIFSTRRYIKK